MLRNGKKLCSPKFEYAQKYVRLNEIHSISIGWLISVELYHPRTPGQFAMFHIEFSLLTATGSRELWPF
jgi:hypothetical protein